MAIYNLNYKLWSVYWESLEGGGEIGLCKRFAHPCNKPEGFYVHEVRRCLNSQARNNEKDYNAFATCQGKGSLKSFLL